MSWGGGKGGATATFFLHRLAGLASLADFFSRHRFFFSFSPNVEPGPRRQKWKQDYNVCIELYGRPVWIYSHFDSDILSE